MASARALTRARPSAKLKTPAAQSAVYSPAERPHTAWGLLTASGFLARSFSRPARPAMKMRGWELTMSRNLASGPSVQTCITSKPRMSLACFSMSWTAGRSCADLSICIFSEPTPGNMMPMGNGSSGGGAGSVAAPPGLACDSNPRTSAGASVSVANLTGIRPRSSSAKAASLFASKSSSTTSALAWCSAAQCKGRAPLASFSFAAPGHLSIRSFTAAASSRSA
mmetsp:Transcript_103788/g.310003  ORF Transcript_103788/g.310003 Transcript_103788/m.310003 type:complete len:224 (+) Transcript_103788:177-848(+)